MEIERVQNECSLADIDFEFVIDSSSSVGSRNWQITMDNIAKYWIQGTVKYFHDIKLIINYRMLKVFVLETEHSFHRHLLTLTF